MNDQIARTTFSARLQRPANPGPEVPWAFLVLPRGASEILPRRGRTTVVGAINGSAFQETLEPDGRLSHWLRVSKELCEAAQADVGDMVTVVLQPVDQEPEPELPTDLQKALHGRPDAQAAWNETTTLARLDWIHWITSARQAKTRAKRIVDACEKLSSGQRRVCCFDPSGFYSKAFKAPRAAE